MSAICESLRGEGYAGRKLIGVCPSAKSEGVGSAKRQSPFPADHGDICSRQFHIGSPCRHEGAAPFRRVAPPKRLFGLVADSMGEGVLGKFPRKVRLVACPVAERWAKPVHGHGDAHATQDHFERHDRQRLAGCRPGNTKSDTRASFISARIAEAGSVNGTRCSRAAFIRLAGIVQTLATFVNFR